MKCLRKILDTHCPKSGSLAPYDAIHVGAAAPTLPPELIDQLASPGRMFVPVGTYAQYILHVDKDEKGNVTHKQVMGVSVGFHFLFADFFGGLHLLIVCSAHRRDQAEGLDFLILGFTLGMALNLFPSLPYRRAKRSTVIRSLHLTS